MPIRVKLDDLDAPPAPEAPPSRAPPAPPSWATPSNRLARQCTVVGSSGVVVRAAAALDSEVVGELPHGARCTVVAESSISRQGRVMARAELGEPLRGWVSSRLLAPNDTEMPVPPAAAATAPSRFYAGARVAAGDREGTAVLRRGNGWLVEFSGGGAVLEERQLTPLNSPTVHWMDAVIDAIGPEAEVVLLGDSTHGTQEYYSMRFEVAQSLVLLYGVTAIAVEGDCVAAGRVDRYVRGVGDDKTAEEALRGFACDDGGTTRWLWRNVPSENFVAWLREHNQTADVKVGFFGLDLFAADRSARAVVEYPTRRRSLESPLSAVASTEYSRPRRGVAATRLPAGTWDVSTTPRRDARKAATLASSRRRLPTTTHLPARRRRESTPELVKRELRRRATRARRCWRTSK